MWSSNDSIGLLGWLSPDEMRQIPADVGEAEAWGSHGSP